MKKIIHKLKGAHRKVIHGGTRTHHGVPVPPKKWHKRWLWYSNPKRFKDFWFTPPGRRTALKLAGIWAGSVFILIAAVFLYFAKDLPSPGQVNSLILKQTTRFYDRTGETLLYEVFGDENRSVVDLDRISEHMQHATIAVEDRNFYQHGAFSSVAIVRAAINNLFGGDGDIQGGSTITQQYVKNALLSPERTFTRKIKELILSVQIEQLYSKDDILELYLNEIPYGTQAYGTQAASKTFFDKDAKDLTIDEAATLASLPRAPTYYSPYGQHTDDLMARRDMIIGLMHEQGYISEEEAEDARDTDTMAKVNQDPNLYAHIQAPHFVLHAQEYLEAKYGSREVNEGGLEVITTIDLDLQEKAEQALAEGINVVDASGGDNAALVASDPGTGEIMALVGSRGFRHPGYGNFNAALANRQPGSSFKPYVYAAGFQTNDWGPGSVMYDVRTDFGGGYTPNNYDRRFRGPTTIRDALANSYNIPAVKMLHIVGMEKALETAHDLGITTLNDPANYGLSLVLGAGEVKLADHVNGYESFANGGLHYDATPILKVTAPDGEVLEDNKDRQGKRVLDPQVSYLIADILSDQAARSQTFGAFNQNMSVPGQTSFVKTGTTDDNRDGWMVGGTRHLVAGVWTGNSDNRPMFGSTTAMTGAIWAPFMQSAHEDKENLPFERPNGIKQVTLDNHTGKLPGGGSRGGNHTDIFPSWYQPKPAPSAQRAVIDKISGKLATECTPPAAREEITGTGIEAEIPPTDPAYSRWNPPVQALASTLGHGRGGTIPTERSDVHSCDDRQPSVALKAEPDGNSIVITVTVTRGTHPLERVVLRANGSVISNRAVGGSITYTVTLNNPKNGNNRFSAEVRDRALYTGTGNVSHSFTGPSDGDDGGNGDG